MWVGAAWGFAFLSLLALAYSAFLFYRRLVVSTPNTRISKVEIFVCQLIVGGALILASVYFDVFDMFFYAEPRLIFLIPLLLLVWLLEGFWLIRYPIKRVQT